MEIDVQDALDAIDQLIGLVQIRVAEATDKQAQKYVAKMKKATDYPFQSVPSYLLEHKFRPNIGAKVYPEGTQATFARKGARLGKTNLEVFTGQDQDIVQHYYGSNNMLLNKLLMQSLVRVDSRKGTVTVDVGYPSDVGSPSSTETRQIPLVYFGTEKMVARPFIEKIVYSNKQEFAQAIANAFAKAIREGTQKALPRRRPVAPTHAREDDPFRTAGAAPQNTFGQRDPGGRQLGQEGNIVSALVAPSAQVVGAEIASWYNFWREISRTQTEDAEVAGQTVQSLARNIDTWRARLSKITAPPKR